MEKAEQPKKETRGRKIKGKCPREEKLDFRTGKNEKSYLKAACRAYNRKMQGKAGFKKLSLYDYVLLCVQENVKREKLPVALVQPELFTEQEIDN